MTITRQKFEQETRAPRREIRAGDITNVTNSNVTLYTAVGFFNLVRIDACPLVATLDLTIYLVPSGGSAGASNKIYDASTITATTSLDSATGVMPPGTAIVAVTNDATGANIKWWGYEISGGDASP